MSNELAGKKALVTGGGYGIGRAIALRLDSLGAEVTVLGRSEEDLNATAAELGNGGRAIVADLTTDSFYDENADVIREFDVIVNNAGGNADKRPFRQETVDGWRATLEINIIAAMRLCSTSLPSMIDRGWGRIVNIASIYGFLAQDPRNQPPEIGNGGYIVAKHGLIGLTRYYAGQLNDSGVTVNAVSPGMIPWRPSTSPAHNEIRANLASKTPLKRNGTPEDIAGAVGYLVTPGVSDWVTGHNLVVDGGWNIW